MSKEQNNYSKRILYIAQYIVQGRRFTSQMLSNFLKENYEIETSLRTIQRDLSIFKEVGFIYEAKSDKKGDGVEYKYQTNDTIHSAPSNMNFSSKLSLHFLKAHLWNFKGTVIEKQINQLSSQLEKIAPGKILLEDMLYWNRSVGDYNYSKYENIIENIVAAIENKNWLRISYKSDINQTKKTHEIFPARIYSYNGTLYLIAYFPKHDSYSLLVIQNILSISIVEDRVDTPINLFDFQQFIESRFAIYGGFNEEIKLKIEKGFEHYFENRHWHSTQKFSRENDNLILEFKSPVSIDLISMIMSWGEGVQVIAPKELKTKIKAKLKETLGKYK